MAPHERAKIGFCRADLVALATAEQKPCDARTVFRYRFGMRCCTRWMRPRSERQAAVPFTSVYVTLTKQEHIEPVMDANSWKGKHRKAMERA